MIKNLMFRLFAWTSKKREKGSNGSGNDLSQPQRDDQNAKKKLLTRRIIIATTILAILTLIVALISYYSTRPKNIFLSGSNNYAVLKLQGVFPNLQNRSSTAAGTQGKDASGKTDSTSTTLTIGENGPATQVDISNATISSAVLDIYTNTTVYEHGANPEYVIDLTPQNLLATYAQTSGYLLTMASTSSSVPVMFDANIISNGNEITVSFFNLTLFYNYSSLSTNSNHETNNCLISFFNSQVLNSVSVQTSNLEWLYVLLDFIPTIIFLLFFVIYFRMMRKQGMGGDSIFSIGKINTKNTKTNVHFSDVAGIAEVKTELMEIVDFIKRPQKYAAMGARIPKGMILYGPPGTGKTLIAKAVAGEANCNFFPVSGSSFEDMLVGVGAKRVRDLFQKARKEAPAIIFIDEIDSVASKRGANEVLGGASGVADQTINQLLTEMDGFTTTTNVVVIAATNRLDILDPAILRPGRFDRQIQVTLPDIAERKAILEIHARNKNLSSKVNLQDIARRTPGFSGAQLENVLNEAAILAVREQQTTISMANLDEAIDRTIGGPQRTTKVITEEEKRQIAYHEGGHALVGLHTPGTEIVQKITIIPRGNAAGYTLQTPQEQERTIQTKEELLNQMRMTLGGRAAEEVIFGPDQITTGAANDLYKVSMIARAMVMQMGMSDLGLTQYVPSESQQPVQKLYSEATNKMIDDKIKAIIDAEYTRAKEIIQKHRQELDLIVETLMVLETILKNQIDYIHQNLALPPEVEAAKQKGSSC